MPSVLCHVIICREVLAAATGGEVASWTARDHDLFIAGSWAPDLGVFPGTVPLITDAAHYVCSGELGRALWINARTSAERAFAAGWCLHILGDVAIHPLINEACGERVWGDRHRPCTWSDSAEWHQRIEIGLDGYEWVSRCGSAMPPWADDEVTSLTATALARAFAITYPGAAFTEEEFLRTARAGYQGVKRLALFTLVDGHRHLRRPVPPRLWPALLFPTIPIRVATALLGNRFRFHPLAKTEYPTDWLQAGFRERSPRSYPRFSKLCLRALLSSVTIISIPGHPSVSEDLMSSILGRFEFMRSYCGGGSGGWHHEKRRVGVTIHPRV